MSFKHNKIITWFIRQRFKVLLSGLIIILGWPISNLVRDEIRLGALDPKLPFQIYIPPIKPNYDQANDWFLNPYLSQYYVDKRKVDVFFIHGTAYDGGREWLAPLDNTKANEHVTKVQLPNFAAPFSITGNIYAPKYRHASLYSHLSMREDARDSRKAAFADINVAFQTFLKTRKGGQGFVIVGIDQGALMAQRLLIDYIAKNEDLRSKLVSVYLIEALVPSSIIPSLGISPCSTAVATGCFIAYKAAEAVRPDVVFENKRKALYWSEQHTLLSVGARETVCVNPILGYVSPEESEVNYSKGATNATGLEWGSQPALMPRKISAKCDNGNLIVNHAHFPSLRSTSDWIEKRKIPPYNMFYGDLKEDIFRRWVAFRREEG
jgi:hypothetical protein